MTRRRSTLLALVALPLACGQPPTSMVVNVRADARLSFGNDFDSLTLFVRPADPTHPGLSKSYSKEALVTAGFPGKPATIALYPGVSETERIAIIVDASRATDGNLSAEAKLDATFVQGQVTQVYLTLPWACRAGTDPNQPGVPCVTGFSCCGGNACVDLSADEKNCGKCGSACAAAQHCDTGACLPCAPGEIHACTVPGAKGLCAEGQEQCNSGGSYGPCTGPAPVGEVCGDGLDQDCDGKVDDGCVSTLAGSAATLDDPGTAAEEGGDHRDGPGPGARFHAPAGITGDGAKQLYVADVKDHAIRRIDLKSVPPAVTTIAGDCPPVATACTAGDKDGDGASAQLNGPSDVVWMPGTAATLYVADRFNGKVKKLAGTPGGSWTVTSLDGALDSPCGVTVDAVGNVWALESTAKDSVWLFPLGAGPGQKITFTGGAWGGSCGLAVMPDTTLFLADADGGKLWHLVRSGAGGSASVVVSGLANPRSMALVGTTLYLADRGNERIVSWPTAGGSVKGVAGVTGSYGWKDGPAASALFAVPFSVTRLAGSLYIADWGSHTIREYVMP